MYTFVEMCCKERTLSRGAAPVVGLFVQTSVWSFQQCERLLLRLLNLLSPISSLFVPQAAASLSTSLKPPAVLGSGAVWREGGPERPSEALRASLVRLLSVSPSL